MNKFERILTASNKEVKETRASMIAKSALLEIETFIGNVKRDKGRIESKIADLTDLVPDTKYSLKPGKDFDSVNWVSELVESKTQLQLITIKLEIAEGIKKEWFDEATEK